MKKISRLNWWRYKTAFIQSALEYVTYLFTFMWNMACRKKHTVLTVTLAGIGCRKWGRKHHKGLGSSYWCREFWVLLWWVVVQRNLLTSLKQFLNLKQSSSVTQNQPEMAIISRKLTEPVVLAYFVVRCMGTGKLQRYFVVSAASANSNSLNVLNRIWWTLYLQHMYSSINAIWTHWWTENVTLR